MTNQTSPTHASFKTGLDVRLAARANECSNTSGLAPSYIQSNLVVLPSRYAADFRSLCARNPVPCPLIAESASTGCWNEIKSHLPTLQGRYLAENLDLRRDAPKYNVFVDSTLNMAGCSDIVQEWTNDHTAFLIGCSFSFESALALAGLPAQHTLQRRNVPMYRTNIPLCPAGAFRTGTFVVSMRPYHRKDLERVRAITARFDATHGEPIDWGWDALERLSITDLDHPEFGDAPLQSDGSPLSNANGQSEVIPVFWGCGVTPQVAVMGAQLEGVVMAHAPGHMIVLDCQDSDMFEMT